MKTVMILGAGITRAAGDSKPLSKRPPLDSDFFDVAKAGKHPNYSEVVKCLESLVGDYSETLLDSLETAASYLYIKAIDSQPNSSYHKGFISLLRLLASVLARTTNGLKLGRRSNLYRFLLNELNKLDKPEDLTIVTFNYDIVVENTLQEIALQNRREAFHFPGCYRLTRFNIVGTNGSPAFESTSNQHAGVKILKLHGSMNWQSRHTSELPRPSALFHPKREINIINSRSLSPSLSWKRKHKTVYMKPIIVPPISGKRGMMHTSVTELWGLAAQSLRDADRVIIAGYSCPPLDLEARILLSENLRQNSGKKVYVVDPDAACASKYIDICGVSHSTIYSSITKWIKDDVRDQ